VSDWRSAERGVPPSKRLGQPPQLVGRDAATRWPADAGCGHVIGQRCEARGLDKFGTRFKG